MLRAQPRPNGVQHLEVFPAAVTIILCSYYLESTDR